jgi:DNA-binding GntR family transcriptional regulator
MLNVICNILHVDESMEKTDIYSKPLNLKSWAYGTIKRRILNVEVNAGEQLGIESREEQLDVSRIQIQGSFLIIG